MHFTLGHKNGGDFAAGNLPSSFDPTVGHLTALVPLLPGNLPCTRKEAWQIPWDTHENLDLFTSVLHYTSFIFVRMYFLRILRMKFPKF